MSGGEKVEIPRGSGRRKRKLPHVYRPQEKANKEKGHLKGKMKHMPRITSKTWCP
jgi:hypothetical protein